MNTLSKLTMALFAALSLGGAMSLPRHAALVLSATAGLSLTLILPAHADDNSKKQKVSSPKYAKHLEAAQDDEQKGKYPEALAEINKARALPNPTPYDTHVINELALYAYAKTKDLADAAKAMGALLNDGFTDTTETNHHINDLARIYYQLEDYGRAIDYGNRAIKLGVADPTMYLLVSQSYYLKGDFANGKQFTEIVVNAEIKQGETPREPQLQLLLSSCVKLGDQPCETRALEQLVTYYPKPEYWQNLLSITAQQKPCEAARVLKEALSSHLLTDQSQRDVFTGRSQRDAAQRLLDAATRGCASGRPAIPGVELKPMPISCLLAANRCA
jgi:tetratricopeptide (TPR) repeat protein